LTGSVPFSGETPVEIAMKHLSEVPDPPSSVRVEVPEDLDMVVVRALAKEPADRYQSAAAMDADLETVAHGGRVPAETAEAATMVLAGTRADDATAVTELVRRDRRGGPPPFEPPKRRAFWPWLLGLGALLAVAAGGFLLFEAIQRQLEASKPVAVPYVVGLRQDQAVDQITRKELVPRVQRVSNSDVAEGFVFGQNPTEGTRVERETEVVIQVSTGKPQVTVPSVVGQGEADAVEELTRAGLDAQIAQVNSAEDEGTVVAQQPEAGAVVVEGTQVRINVSKGPRPINVPSVEGATYEEASAELRRAGFEVSRVDVANSDFAAGIVVDQDPAGGSEAARGSTVTLSVSRGPTTSAVPDVTNQEATVAVATLENAGFRTREVVEDTDDPAQDGIVIAQDPIGSTQANRNTIVTLFVGRFTGATTEEVETVPTEP
jgi:eukaryotic-like serine/threonine-protein kinase